jgi:MoaA/NifB/PqqE/SkfB family radical SAM enzyme
MPSPPVSTELHETEQTMEAPLAPRLHENDLSPHRLRTLPILILNVHERCNCRCMMCDIWKRESGAELGIDELARHRESIVKLGVRQVVLTGGEPLLHSNLSAICSFLRECGVRITLLSTGLLLKKRAELVATSMDEVIVSLDGPEEVHDDVRRVKRGFQLIGEGIFAVRQVKALMPIHARSTVQKSNHALLRQTVLAAHSLGLDSISFLAADVTSQAFNRELVWPGERQNEIALSRSEVNALEAEVELLIREHSDDIASKYIVEPPEKLRAISRRFREHLGEISPEAPRCNAPWVSAVVEVDGSVRPCFFHCKIGSLKTASLEEVLNGEAAQSFRNTLNIPENPICRRCVCSLHYKK